MADGRAVTESKYTYGSNPTNRFYTSIDTAQLRLLIKTFIDYDFFALPDHLVSLTADCPNMVCDYGSDEITIRLNGKNKTVTYDGCFGSESASKVVFLLSLIRSVISGEH